MSIFTLNGKRINIESPIVTTEGTRYPNLRDPLIRSVLSIEEISEPTPPVDYSDLLYYRNEQDDAPYVVYTRKSDEQIAQIYANMVEEKKARVRAAREVVINRLVGIADRYSRKGNFAIASACDTAVEALLQITDNWPLDPLLVDAVVLHRWQAIAAELAQSTEAATAFNKISL